MRLIDADELFKEIATLSVDGSNPMGQGYCAGISDVSNLITNQPTIEPVKRGEWLESECFDYCFWVCSNCRFPSEALAAPRLYKYCPQCGAKMDGEANV